MDRWTDRCEIITFPHIIYAAIKMSKDVKLSKRCQMSRKQTGRLWRRFTKKLIDIMWFTHIDINFDITYHDHQKPSKCR